MNDLKDAHLEEYLQYKINYRLLASSTIQKIETQLNLFITYLINEGIKSIKEVNSNIIREYLSHNRNNMYKLFKRKRSLRTIEGKREDLHTYFEYLFQMQYIDCNPVAGVPHILLPQKMPIILSLNDVIRLLEFIMKKQKKLLQFKLRDRLYIGLIIFYGLKNHEVFKIKMKDIDLCKSEITIKQSSLQDTRVLPLFSPAREWLLEYIKTRKNHESDFLFQNIWSKTPYNSANSKRWLIALSKKYGKKLSSKIFRNTFFSFMFEAKIEPRIVQAIVGAHTLKNIKRMSVFSVSNKRYAVNRIAVD